MRTLVSLLLIALALYTVEALAQESAKTWNQEAGVMPLPDQGAKVQATVGAPGNDCDACIKNMDPDIRLVKDQKIEPAGTASTGGPSTTGSGQK